MYLFSDWHSNFFFLVVESITQNLWFKVTFSVRRTSDRVGLNRPAVLVVMLGKSLK